MRARPQRIIAIGTRRMSDSHVSGYPRVIDSASIVPLAEEQIIGAVHVGADELAVSSVIEPAASAPAAALVGRASRTGLILSVHSDLDPIDREWRAFEREAGGTAFQSFDWVARWQQHIGARRGTVPVIVVGRSAGGRLLFILPLAIERRGPVRELCWLGSDLCDYNAPLLAERFHDHVGTDGFAPLWRDIVGLLRTSRRFRFDLIDLQKMPETIGRQMNPLLALPVVTNPSGAHIATLGGEWEKFYAAKRSSATRKRERGKLKQLAEHGDIRFIDAQDGVGIVRTMDVLIAQKARSLARLGVENFLARPGYREFFLDLATDPRLRDLVHVGRMDVGAMLAAASFGLTFRGCYYLLLSSYHDGELAKFGPGRTHLHELLRHAIGRGLDRFDFTIGDEAYKREWSDIELKLYDYTAAATTRGWPVVTLMLAFRRTKRFIKQTPPLWRVFSKARTLAGRLSDRLVHFTSGKR